MLYLLFGLTALSQFNLDLFQNEQKQWAIADLTSMTHLEITGGTGEKTDSFRIAAHWDFFDSGFANTDMTMSLAANYAIFNNPNLGKKRVAHIRDLGLTPVFRFQSRKTWLGLKPTLEAGIGFHYLSERDVGEKTFSTRFQFGDHIGIGVVTGKRDALRITYRFQHLSNGGIDAPNPGINFHLLSIGYRIN